MLFLRLLGTAWLFPVPLSVCPLLLPLSVSSLLACGPAPLLTGRHVASAHTATDLPAVWRTPRWG